MKKSCLIVNFYFGDRRKCIKEYNEIDRLCLLKKQISTLHYFNHSLSKIIFTFNMRNEDFKYVSDIFKLTPKFIQGSEVEINFRENVGGSYGGWNDSFEKWKDDYEYYIFNEDDYFFIRDNWDDYLINKYNALGDCGYLCGVVQEPYYRNGFRKNLGMSVGIASSKNLMKIYNNEGKICTNDACSYKDLERVQKTFAKSFFDLGLNVYDIRDDFRLAFAWTEDDGVDIHKYFWWNDLDLLSPAFFMFSHSGYRWWACTDGQYLEGYPGTTTEEALKCLNEGINNWDLPSYKKLKLKKQ